MKGRYKSFLACFKCEVLKCFLVPVFLLGLELETDFLQTRCVVVTATDAIVEVAKLYQIEHEHIRVYTSKFEIY